MTGTVSGILEARLASGHVGSFRRALTIAVVLHASVAVAAWLGPILFAKPAQPIDFVSVRIVPAARLGIPEPKPAPKPVEPVKPTPAPEPKPESKAPALPSPKAKPTPAKPQPKPQTAAPAAAAKAAPAEAEPQPQGVEDGALAGMALGAPTATFDTPDFTYGYYVDQMLSQISANWNRPLVGGGVEAWLHFEIARNGEVSDIRITRSSGINSFDLAALRAVQASSPLPPLPRAFRESSLGVNLIVR